MKKKFTSWWALVKRNPKRSGIGAVLVLLVAWFVFGGGSDEPQELLTVTRGDFVQEVSVSGKVEAAQDVDLTFPETGRVDRIAVSVGDTVTAGTPLAYLSMGTLQSDLRAAEATLALRRAESNSASINLAEIRKEQDALVASAYAKLLSTDLTSVPRSSSYTATPPTISGLYQGAEGTYEFRVKRGINSDQYELYVFGLERAEEIDILKNEGTPLGTKGLYVSFPDTLGEYVDTNWSIAIPNVRAASYTTYYHAYQQALQTRDRVVSEAEAQLRSGTGTAVLDAQIEQAEAEVARIRASINERILHAPFTGIVTAVDIKVGAAVSLSTPAISLIGADTLQVESYIPEVNVSYVSVGDVAEVTLDAYGELIPFPAKVISIDPAETLRDGVSMYRTILAFDTQDERIKAGMTANVRITTDEKSGVITVPQGIVTMKNGQHLVPVWVDEKVEDRAVTVGTVSSLGTIEILSGLSEGDTVVVSPR